MPYIPGSAPADITSVDQLRSWFEEELRRLALSLSTHDAVQFNVLYAAPAGPTEGMMVFADGTTWNPGSGAGAYAYVGGSWVKL